MSAQHTPPVCYWVNAAREQSRWCVSLRREARATRRCRASGRLYDEARRCAARVSIFMQEARRMRAALAKAGAA